MIKVSLIIPCFNASPYIDKCLNIILKDPLKDKEIILINDGSTDNTLDILNKYAKNNKEIKIINQDNMGQAVSRNKALKIAQGEYIMFVDIDDYLKEDAIYEMYNKAVEHNSDYVYSDYYEHYYDKDVLKSNKITDAEKKNALLINFAPWGKLISRKLIKKINFQFLDGKIFEDIAVIPFLAANSKNPYYLNNPYYYYNMTNTNSTIRTKEYKKKYEDIFAVSDYMYKLFIDSNLINEYYDELEFIYIKGILRSNTMLFAKYKEGLKNISLLRKNVLSKFPNLIKNKYLHKECLKNRIVTLLSLYMPPYFLFLIKKLDK